MKLRAFVSLGAVMALGLSQAACGPNGLTSDEQVAISGLGTIAFSGLCAIGANQYAKVNPNTNGALAAKIALDTACADPSKTAAAVTAAFNSLATQLHQPVAKPLSAATAAAVGVAPATATSGAAAAGAAVGAKVPTS